MKSLKISHQAMLAGALAFGIAGFLLPGVGLAEGKGASKLMNVQNLAADHQSPSHVTLKPEMSCTRCSDALVKVSEPAKGMRAASVRNVPMHQCPACSTRITTSGSGKAKADKVEHRCAMSAAANSSCCMAAK